MDNQEKLYNDIEIPDFTDMYKAEALKLLKMINEQMNFYFTRNRSNIDVFNVYQVLKKIETFQTNIPGIDMLKKSLIEDIQQLAKHLEANFIEKRTRFANEIAMIEKDLLETKRRKTVTLVKIILLHWFLIPEFFKLNKNISNLNRMLKNIKEDELREKRETFNEAQLIYISHRFREKYLNIPMPEGQTKDIF